jgi:hypothetical protein
MNKKISDQSDKGDVWNKVLRTALAIPGSRIDRATFLRKELSKHVSADVLEAAVATTPAKAGVPALLVSRLAKGSISWHRTGVTTASAAAGLPGGWWMAGTIPADMAQYFWHIVVILQKLAYLHGWPDLFNDGEELDDESLHILTIFIGVMFGAAGATQVLNVLSEKVSAQVAKRLPRYALTKWGLYKLAKEVAKWIGVQLTKETFARMLSKVVPLLGALVSGSITWISYSRMSTKLRQHLEVLLPHTSTL